MDQKYIKCVLTLGYAIVSEKKDTTSNWFPVVNFYGIDGLHIATIPDHTMSTLFKALLVMNDAFADRGDSDVCSFAQGNQILKLVWRAGWLHLLPKNLGESESTDYLVSMDHPAALELYKAINQLA